jgi:hypothetical protein
MNDGRVYTGVGTGVSWLWGVWPERDLKHVGVVPSCHYGKS